MINRILLVICASLFLAACGGGGGGGGGTTNNTGSDNNTGGNDSTDQGGGDEQQAEFVQQQHESLPLIQGAGWEFGDAGISMTATLEENLNITDVTDPIYSLSSEITGLGTLKQYFVSLPDEIYLAGLGGPIDVPIPGLAGATFPVSSVYFAKPIQIVGDSLTNETLDVVINGNIRDLDANVSVSNEPSTAVIDIGGQSATFTSTLVTVNIHLSGTILNLPVDLTIAEESELVAGVGFVKRVISVDTFDGLDLEMTDLINLLVPIKYHVFQGNTVQIGDNTVRTRDGAVDPDGYDVLSEDVPSWIDISESIAGDVFTAQVVDNNLPSETTTQVVYIGATGQDSQIPLNVTVEIAAE